MQGEQKAGFNLFSTAKRDPLEPQFIDGLLIKMMRAVLTHKKSRTKARFHNILKTLMLKNQATNGCHYTHYLVHKIMLLPHYLS